MKLSFNQEALEGNALLMLNQLEAALEALKAKGQDDYLTESIERTIANIRGE